MKVIKEDIILLLKDVNIEKKGVIHIGHYQGEEVSALRMY